MNNSSFSFYSNVFGFVVGGVSLLGFVVAACRPHLPSNKIKMLESLLHDTESALNEAVEAELLVHEFIERAEDRLTGWVQHHLCFKGLTRSFCQTEGADLQPASPRI